MPFISQAKLAQDPTFRSQVQIAVVAAAVMIQGEAIGGMSSAKYGKRQSLASRVLADSLRYLDSFAWAVAQNAVVATQAPVSVTASTAANPIVVTTATNHGLATGDTALIAGHAGNTVANGAWVVTNLTAVTFSIPALGTGAGTGGTVVEYPPDNDIAFTISSVWDDLASVTGAE